jgi:hypothetical protein
MNDKRKLLLERYFDGELPAEARDALHRELAGDPAASRHLDQLGVLRKLARAHDPTARRRRSGWFVAAGALAASLLLIVLSAPRIRPAVRGPASSSAESPEAISVAVRPTAVPSSAAIPLEVELIRLANAPSRGPEGAARAVLSRVPGSPSQRRPASQEILALELANGSPRAPLALPRAAATPGVTASGPARRHPPSTRSHVPTSPKGA